MITIGIDPGLTGGIAFVSDYGYSVHDLPVIRDKSLSWIDGGELQSIILRERYAAKHFQCFVERVGYMPGNAGPSGFNFGCSFGSVLSIIQSLQISLQLVTPVTWKKALGLGKEKAAAIDKARLLFPLANLSMRKHDGRAEALLIAHYARTKLQAKEAA